MHFMWFSYVAFTRFRACRGCQILPHGAPLRPERKCISFGGLWRLWFGLKCAPAPSRADVLAAESWITPAKSMSSLAVPRKRPFTSNFDNRDIRLLPATHWSTWGGHFPCSFVWLDFAIPPAKSQGTTLMYVIISASPLMMMAFRCRSLARSPWPDNR